jgi:hypothetical protein
MEIRNLTNGVICLFISIVEDGRFFDTPVALSQRRSKGSRGISCCMSEGVYSLIRDRGEAINTIDARGEIIYGESNSIMRSTAPHFCRANLLLFLYEE